MSPASINMANFRANICANVAFWFNQYKSSYIMQPILFTALATLGFALMMLHKKQQACGNMHRAVVPCLLPALCGLLCRFCHLRR